MADLPRFPKLDPADSRMAELLFEFVQLLLDDDAHLTPAGNLTGDARQKLRARVEELIAAETLAGRASDGPTTPAAPSLARPANSVTADSGEAL